MRPITQKYVSCRELCGTERTEALEDGARFCKEMLAIEVGDELCWTFALLGAQCALLYSELMNPPFFR